VESTVGEAVISEAFKESKDKSPTSR